MIIQYSKATEIIIDLEANERERVRFSKRQLVETRASETFHKRARKSPNQTLVSARRVTGYIGTYRQFARAFSVEQ